VTDVEVIVVESGRVEEVSVEEAWQRLSTDSSAVLIDVRTQAEWSFVGVADLSTIGKQTLLIEWQNYPEGQVSPDFPERLESMLEAAGADKATQLLFICRSGARSLNAARAMTAAGYSRAANVTGGFEGPLDGQRHRGGVAGWKARGLPWVQG